MSKNKKNIIFLIVAVILLGGLAGVYVWQGQRQAQAEAAAEPTPTPVTSFKLIDKIEADIAKVVFTTADHELTLTPRRETGADDTETTTWVLGEDPGAVISQSTAGNMIRGLYTLTASERIADQVDNPTDFGFGAEGARAVATYTDGSQAVVYVGKNTPAKDKYYIMIEGDPALYLISNYYGERFLNDVGALLDRTMPTIDGQTIEYIYIKERDKQPVEFGFYGTEAEKDEMYEQYGMIYVKMLQPYPGRELYYTNFEQNILTDFGSFALGDLVAMNPDDLSAYGLNDPSLEIWFRDMTNELHLIFGDRTDDGLIYCKYYDRPQVFLAEYNYVKTMYNINVFTFIERFVALVNIEECVAIDITSSGDDSLNYHMVLDHIQMPPAEGEEEGETELFPYVNGQSVQTLAFRTFYQRLIGLSYDTEIEVYEPTEEPAFTVTYTMKDGKEPITVRYYAFDINFYAVQRDDNPIQFVSNRQSADIMFQAIVDLLAGKLDRDY